MTPASSLDSPSVVAPLDPPAADDRPIWDAWLARLHLPALAVADELGLFPLLADAPLTAEATAGALTLSPAGAEALLGALAALGFLARHEGRFSPTAAARTYLLPGSPYYYGPMLRFVTLAPSDPASLLASLRPKTVAETVEVDGRVLLRAWQAATLPPELAERFTAMIDALSLPAALAAARWGDFASVRRLLDVAGGSGCFAIALARRYPGLRCTILELPSVCPIAARYVADAGLAERIDTTAANMFIDPWPAGYDAVLLSNVFHDWDRASCLHLARYAFAALPPGGRIYLHETLLADTRDGPPLVAAYSLHMVRVGLGKQYTAGELGALLREAGFGAVSITPTAADNALICAAKPA